MSKHRRQRSNRTRFSVLATLIVISILLFVLPRSWTGRLISLAQVLLPAQLVGRSATDAASNLVTPTESINVHPQVFSDVERQRDALQHEAIALAAHVDDLQREVQVLSGTRGFTVDGRSLGARGQLVPARVVADDLLQWRSSLLLSAGTSHGVKPGDPVASRFFTVDRGQTHGMKSGMAILRGESLVGWIEDVGTHTSRVKLMSDISVQTKVRIGRLTDRGVALVEGYRWLRGRGRGRMEIKDVDRRLVDPARPAIQVGDLVVSDPSHGQLPTAMTIGVVEAISPDRDNPLLVILAVKAAVDESDLDRVYVYDSSEP